MRFRVAHRSVDRAAAHPLSLLAAAVALWFAAAPAGAQPQPAQPPPSTFTETIDVSVVNVDVWVTDRDGNPVTGLQAGDFEVRENDRPVELSNFYEFTDGQEVGTQRATPASGRDPPRPSDLDRFIPAEPPPPEHRLSLMVYVDNYNLTPTDRNRLLPFLRDFLRTELSPYDRVMLAVFDQRRFEVVLPFTTEAWRIAEATYEVEKVVGSRERTESERLDILREINRDDAAYFQVIGLVRNFATTVSSEVDASVANLRDAIRTMAGLPGRKSVLYISNGLPMRSAEDLFRAVEERFSDSRGRWRGGATPFTNPSGGLDVSNASLEAYQYDLSRRFDEIASLANANRVTFHGIAAAGTRISGMNTADLRFSSSIESTHANNLQETLLYMADRTGGQAIVNTRNFAGGFDRIASDFRNRYSLGYSPTHIQRGRAHRIEVELTDQARKRHRGRLSVRYRDSYIDKPVSTEMADITLAALTMGETANSMGVRVAAVRGPGSQAALDSGDIQSRLLVAVPIGALTLAPAAEDHEGRFRLWVQVSDDEGRASEVTEHSVPVVVKQDEIEEARQRSWPFVLDLVTAPGPHRVAVAARDDLAATTSVVTFDLDAGNGPTAPVEAANAEAPAAEAPPLPDTPERWLAEAAAHYQRGQLEQMANAARRVLALTEDIRPRTRAYNLLGVALFDKPGRTEQEVLEAEDAFRRVISVMDDESSLAPRYSLAKLLLDSGRPEEGVAEARSILALAARGPIPDRARILVCHARASTETADDPRAATAANAAREPGEMIYEVAHEYTGEARLAGTEGVVTLRSSIDREGCVIDVETLEALPHGLTESAVAAVRRAVFRPAMENGEPVASTYESAARFALEADP